MAVLRVVGADRAVADDAPRGGEDAAGLVAGDEIDGRVSND